MKTIDDIKTTYGKDVPPAFIVDVLMDRPFAVSLLEQAKLTAGLVVGILSDGWGEQEEAKAVSEIVAPIYSALRVHVE